MLKARKDKKADINAVSKGGEDDGEAPALMEPLLIREVARNRAGLPDLALTLAQKSAGFRRSLPPSLLASLAALVRTMNCYYSDLNRGPRYTPDRYRARPQEGLQRGSREARPSA